jgi:hypothetical protein
MSPYTTLQRDTERERERKRERERGGEGEKKRDRRVIVIYEMHDYLITCMVRVHYY